MDERRRPRRSGRGGPSGLEPTHALGEGLFGDGAPDLLHLPLQIPALRRPPPHPREAPEAIEELGPRERSALVHEVLYETLDILRQDGALPITRNNLDVASRRLDLVLARTADRYRDELAPAIERVWKDGIDSVLADLREWLRRASEDGAWTPQRFELSFGLRERKTRDPSSQESAVELDCGIRLRGAIDLVEQDAGGALRATDYKTGRAQARAGATVVNGDRTLQPVLYALALEKLFPEARIEAGRLYYCTSAGGSEEVPIPLDDRARSAATTVAKVIGKALSEGFLPAAPDAGPANTASIARCAALTRSCARAGRARSGSTICERSGSCFERRAIAEMKSRQSSRKWHCRASNRKLTHRRDFRLRPH